MAKLWSKTDQDDELTDWVESFTVGIDYQLDRVLLPYDIQASIAHAKGLEKIGILTKEELNQLEACLERIEEAFEAGSFQILRRHEDVHTAIEEFLTKELGEVGKKIHTGRSRNDQVLTAVRLYEKDSLHSIQESLSGLAKAFLTFARQNEFIPMPGYTHTQPAMLSSVGMWAGSFAELLIHEKEFLTSVNESINYCPLGSAAGFGVNIPLDREYLSALLGFKAPLVVSMSAQTTRGKWEARIVQALAGATAILSQFAEDLIRYSSKEFCFLNVDERLTTGSSIMPQKKNQDVAELLRAKHIDLLAHQQHLQHTTLRLGSGYHRDLQLTKEPLIRSFELANEMIQAATKLINHLSIDEVQILSKLYPEMLAADEANELVKQGLPFREAYQKIANELDTLKLEDVDTYLRSRTHLGATGNLGLGILEKRL
jgi:argininosuccinate lyase